MHKYKLYVRHILIEGFFRVGKKDLKRNLLCLTSQPLLNIIVKVNPSFEDDIWAGRLIPAGGIVYSGDVGLSDVLFLFFMIPNFIFYYFFYVI